MKDEDGKIKIFTPVRWVQQPSSAPDLPPVKTCAKLRWCWWGWEERRRDGDNRRWEIKDLSPQHQQRANSPCVKLPDNSEGTASVETGCPAEPLRDSLGLEMRRCDKLLRSAVDLTGGASKFIFLLPFPPSLLLSSSLTTQLPVPYTGHRAR